MSIPQPAKDIDGHCSAIVDNTLYVLSSNSFQSLRLKPHAQWSKEAIGVAVTGPACVQVGDDSNAYLYVIGGETDDSSFSGLQIYSFKTKSWETIPTQAPVLQGRTNHSAAYLQDSQSIISYAGSQPNAPSYLSSQTFLISTVEPYTINSYTSYAPTANLPILQPFNTSHAVMVGGSELNTQVWIFEPTTGFQPLGFDILSPLPSTARGIVLDGSDGSKVLEVYDTSVSPNNVSQIVLQGEYGQPAYTGQTVGTPPSRKRKRDLTLGNWPAYNGTNAPTATRTDSSIAQGFRVSVIAGGNNKDPVAIFNNNDNSWIDAADFFDSKQVKQQPLKPTKSSKPTSTTSTSTSTASASASSTTAAAAPSDSAAHDRMVRTLGITLGVLCGIAAIFILVLIFLRWRKMKKRKAEGYLDEKENDNTRMSFADRGASFMKEAGGSINGLPPPGKAWNNSPNNSHSSLAIITGRFGKRNTNGHQPNASYDSTARLVKDKNGTAIGGEPVEMVDLDEKKMAVQRTPSMIARTEPKVPPAHYGPNLTAEDAKDAADRRKRSSGWSKYFATSQPTGPNGLSHLPSAYGKGTNTYSDASMYSNDRGVSQPSQIPSSALVPPLDLDFTKMDGQRLSHVASGSPAFNDSREDLASRGSLAPEGQRGLIVDPSRPRSQSETISSYNRSTMSSTMTTSEYYDNTGATPWTPTSTSFKDHLNSRPTSSVYDPRERVPSRGKSSNFFPGSGTSAYRPRSKATKLGHSGAPTSDWAAPTRKNSTLKAPQRPADDRDSTVTVFPTGVPSTQYPGKEIQPPKITRPWASNAPEDRDSTLTQFPGVPSAYYPGKDRVQEPAKPVNSDLGWLNLNESQTRL
jgi:hypothetical protein